MSARTIALCGANPDELFPVLLPMCRTFDNYTDSMYIFVIYNLICAYIQLLFPTTYPVK